MEYSLEFWFSISGLASDEHAVAVHALVSELLRREQIADHISQYSFSEQDGEWDWEAYTDEPVTRTWPIDWFEEFEAEFRRCVMEAASGAEVIVECEIPQDED